MQAAPYLNFDGRCAEAFRFYARVLDGTVEMRTHGESPIADQVPAETHDRILHARLVAGDAVLMGSDGPPGETVEHQGVWVALQLDSPAEAERVFREMADGGTVTMPIEKTFWAERFGMLVDRYGVQWMVNCAAAATGDSTVSVDPTIEERPERPYVAIPIRVTLKEWDRANALFGEIFEWLDRNGHEPAGAPFIRYYVIGDDDRQYEIEVGVPLAEPVPGDDRVVTGTMPAGSYAIVVHTGHPDELFDVDAALQARAEDRDLEWANSTEDDREVWGARFESFLTNPEEQPDPSRWSTELAYLLEPEAVHAGGGG